MGPTMEKKGIIIVAVSIALIASLGYLFVIRPEQRLREEMDYYRTTNVYLLDVTNSTEKKQWSLESYTWKEFKEQMDPAAKASMVFEVSSTELREIVAGRWGLWGSTFNPVFVDPNAKVMWSGLIEDPESPVFYWKAGS